MKYYRRFVENKLKYRYLLLSAFSFLRFLPTTYWLSPNRCYLSLFLYLGCSVVSLLAPVVQMLDSAVHWINHSPADKY